MKIREIAYLTIRITAIYFFVRSISSLPNLLAYFPIRQNFPEVGLEPLIITLYLMPFAINMLVSLLLWFGVSKWIRLFLYEEDTIGRENEDEDVGGIGNENEDVKGSGNVALSELKVLAFTIVGLVIILMTFPQLGNAIASLIDVNKYDGFSDRYKWQFTSTLVLVVIKLLLGLALLFKSKDIIRLLKI